MNTKAKSCVLGFGILAMVVWATVGAGGQSGDPVNEPPKSIAAPVADAAAPRAQNTAASSDALIKEENKEGQAIPAVAVLDDAVPLPDRGQIAAGDQGDAKVADATGNPYFLGFVGSRYFPPEGERVDPVLAALTTADQAPPQPSRATYAFVMFQKRITPARTAELETLGARVLGFHPHYCLKVALQPQTVNAVAALPAVRWIGFPKPEQKVDPALGQRVANAGPEELIDAYVNVFESDRNETSTFAPLGTVWTVDSGQRPQADPRGSTTGIWMSNGWQQKELENRGVQVVAYVDRTRSFKVRATPTMISGILNLDFVLFVELHLCPKLSHDESTAMIHSDSTRADYTGGTNSVIVGGQMDSGIDQAHNALNHINGVGWDLASSGTGPWHDGEEHGSHVAGTFVGDGGDVASLRGNAPGLGWGGTGRFFNAKIMNDTGGPSCSSFPPTSTLVTVMHTPYTDGGGATTPIPHVINNSWGCPDTTAGTDTNSRTIDAEVWDYNQFYVFAAGNEGSTGSTIRSPGAAKNAFTVGSVVDFYDAASGGDPGIVADTSSRGPTADNRWKPNICAPGRWIRSVNANSGNLFTNKSGTSMAAPHVSGVAAQVMDNFSFLRYAPHRLASMLMATAITKDNVTLSAPSTDPTNHLNQYGAGRIEAYRAHFGTSQFGWTNWGVTQTSANSFYGDFTVNTGATRLIVCMNYIEDAASAGASQALVNDIDLWIDHEPIDPAGNTGEYFAQQSPRDNTEIRIINNPPTGAWRWKTWPQSMTGSARVGITVSVIYGDTTPDGTQTLTATDTTIQPAQEVDITSTVTNPSYVASAVYLDLTPPAGTTLMGSTTTLKDGAVTDLTTNPQFGVDVLLGDIVHDQTRSATWTLRWATEGTKAVSVQARSDNWVDETDSINIVVDGTPPGLVTNLASSTHSVNVWSNNPNITYVWTAAIDNLSGVDGYGIFTSSSAPGIPGATKDIEEVTTYSEVLASSASGRYFNIRTVDNSGNWGADYASTGPYLVDTVAPTSPTARINGGAPSTMSLIVALDNLTAVDGHSGVFQMQFSNNGTTWSPLEPYAAMRGGWDMSTLGGNSAQGTKTVYVRYRDRAGNLSSVGSDTILYSCNPCDTSCDGTVNGLDIKGFIAALTGFQPACSSCNSDANNDGSVSVLDINAFVACLMTP